MAALGGVDHHYIKFSGYDDVPAGLSAVTSAPGTYGLVALYALSRDMVLAIWQHDAMNLSRDMVLAIWQHDAMNEAATAVTQSGSASTPKTAQQGTLTKDAWRCCGVGPSCSGPPHQRRWLQQLGLGAVRQRGSRVKWHPTAWPWCCSPAWFPKQFLHLHRAGHGAITVSSTQGFVRHWRQRHPRRNHELRKDGGRCF
jgi:hypothetical protein